MRNIDASPVREPLSSLRVKAGVLNQRRINEFSMDFIDPLAFPDEEITGRNLNETKRKINPLRNCQKLIFKKVLDDFRYMN